MPSPRPWSMPSPRPFRARARPAPISGDHARTGLARALVALAAASSAATGGSSLLIGAPAQRNTAGRAGSRRLQARSWPAPQVMTTGLARDSLDAVSRPRDQREAQRWTALGGGTDPVGVRARAGGDGQRGPRRVAALRPDPAGGCPHGPGGPRGRGAAAGHGSAAVATRRHSGAVP